MIVRELLAKFGLALDESSFKKADSLTDSVKDGLHRLAEAFVIYEISSKFKELVLGTVEAAAKVKDLSDQIGVSTDAIQELRYAAKLSGMEIEGFDHALTILTKTAATASQGNEEAVKTFAQFGIKFRDANGHVRKADDLLFDISDKMKEATTQTERMGIATKFFGERGGGKLAILLKDGSAAVRELTQEAHDLGAVMDEDMIGKAAEVDDNLDRVSFAVQGVKNTIVGAMLPGIKAATDGIIKWVKANRLLLQQKVSQWAETAVRWFKKVASALITIGQAGAYLIDLFGGVKNVVLALAAALGLYLLFQIGEAILAFGALTVSALIAKAAMIGDVILIGAAFVALAAIIFMLGEEIGAAFDPDKLGLFEAMRGKWGDLVDRIMDGFSMTEDAGGNLMKLILAIPVLAIDAFDKFFDLQFQLMTAWGAAWDFIVTGIELAPTRIESAWKNLWKWLDPKIQAVTDLMDKVSNFDTGTALSNMFEKGSLPNQIFSGNVSASPAAVAAGNSKATVATSVEVNVDAQGQQLNEGVLSSMIRQHVDAVLTSSNRQALEALTPAGGT